MGSINKCIIVGNVVRDPEIRHTQDGKAIVNLTVATSERWMDKATGERKERSEFHRVVIFNEALAKVAEQYVKKGSLIYIEGQLQTRKWTDKDGVEKYSTEIVLQQYRGELTLLGGKPEGEAPARGKEVPGFTKPVFDKTKAGGFDDLNDEIPF